VVEPERAVGVQFIGARDDFLAHLDRYLEQLAR
jgi:hypothetical protein